jgi:hypothetical protein
MGPDQIDNPLTQATKEVMIVELASKLHDMWREPRRVENPTPGEPTFEPRMKEVGGVQYDIANLKYTELPGKFQAENRAAAEGALGEIPMLTRQFGKERLGEDAAIEALADVVHKQWMERNGSWAPEEQMVPYSDLPDSEKEKDRVIARAAIETYLKETA